MMYRSRGLSKNGFRPYLPVIILCYLLIFSTVLVGCSTGFEVNNINYSKDITLNESSLYYSSTISESEAENLLKYLVNEELNEFDCLLNKNEDTYEVSFVLVNSSEKIDDEMILDLQLLSGDMSKNIFSEGKVDINLCDEDWNTLHKIPSSDAILQIEAGGGIVYYKPHISKSEAESLAKYLVDQEFSEFEILLGKNENAYELSIVSTYSSEEIDDETILDFQILSGAMSSDVFRGAKVDINLCDENLKVLHAIPSSDAILRKEFNGGILHYFPTISEWEMEAVGNYLIELGYFDGEESEVILGQYENAYHLALVLEENIEDDDVIQLLKEVCKDLSEAIFNGNKVYISLVDENYDILREITY